MGGFSRNWICALTLGIVKVGCWGSRLTGVLDRCVAVVPTLAGVCGNRTCDSAMPMHPMTAALLVHLSVLCLLPSTLLPSSSYKSPERQADSHSTEEENETQNTVPCVTLVMIGRTQEDITVALIFLSGTSVKF